MPVFRFKSQKGRIYHLRKESRSNRLKTAKTKKSGAFHNAPPLKIIIVNMSFHTANITKKATRITTSC